MPKEKEIHIICDNYATHKHPKVIKRAKILPTMPCVLHTNQRIVVKQGGTVFLKPTEKQLKRGVFSSVEEREESVMTFIDIHHQAPAPHIRTKSANDILERFWRE